MTVPTLADQLALSVIRATLSDAREEGDERPALDVLAGSLLRAEEGRRSALRAARLLLAERDLYLRQLRDARRGPRTLAAYRVAIDDLLGWAGRELRIEQLHDTAAIADYLADYRQRCRPAPATYRHRFVLLRSFMTWITRRHDTANPFHELQLPPKTSSNGPTAEARRCQSSLAAGSPSARSGSRPGAAGRWDRGRGFRKPAA